jgi:NTE family protein
MAIKHIVISGGGISGFSTYGALRFLSKQNFWKLDEIKTIYGCSIGAFIGVVISLGYDWDWLDDYFEKRPWEKIINIGINEILNLYEKKGVLDISFVEKALEPLLTAKGLTKDCTFEEFFAYTKIDIHMFTVDINLNELKTINLSYKTHPKLPIFKGVYMTMSFPFLLKPLCEDGHCYIDGGIIDNYPLQYCINDTECDTNEILGIINEWGNFMEKYKVTDKSSIIDYLRVLMRKMHLQIATENKQINIKHTVRCALDSDIAFTDWVSILTQENMRSKFINSGSQQAKIFFDYINSE